MARRKAHTPLHVFISDRHVGTLNKQTSGAIEFSYVAGWLEWEHAFPVSVSLPLTDEKYAGVPVAAVFENLLPDSVPIRTRVAERVGAKGTDAYSLLAEIGRDCVGAMMFLPEGDDPAKQTGIEGIPQSENDVEATLKNLGRAPLGVGREDDFRISVAGAQEKTALLWHEGQWLRPIGATPTSHILKPQIGTIETAGGTIDLSNSVENEHYCLTLLRCFGLETASTEIVTFGATKTLVVERFDRRWAPDGRIIRLPQEDLCQALSIPPTAKYQNEGGPSLCDVMQVLQASDDPLEDRLAVFKAQILFWLIGAPDGHAKNFSIFLRPGGGISLTPLYDVLTGQPAVDAHQIRLNSFKLAMSVGSNRHYRFRDIVGRHFVETGVEAKLSTELVEKAIGEIVDRADHALEQAAETMPEDFPEELVASVTTAVSKRCLLLEQA